MMFLNFITCSLLQVSLWFMLLPYIVCECKFPDNDFPGGKIIYRSPNDVNKTFAEDLYILQFECLPGYELIGKRYIKCEHEEWIPEVPFCANIHCGTPPSLANGTILELQSTNLTSFPYNLGLTYVCDESFRLIGDSWSVCRKGGWSGKTPTCEAKRCPNPGVPENGIRMGDSYTVGSSVHFDCYEGYDLLGSPERHCLPNEQWTGDLARCNLPSNYCPNPGIPIKGSKNSTNYDLGSKLVFRCQSGYRRLGSKVRECLVDRTWSGTEVKCLEVFCDPPPPFDNGTILELHSKNQTVFPFNFELTYVCDENHRLIGDDWRVCGRRGWSGKTPICEVTECPDPGIPENGIRMGDNYAVGSMVRFRCYEGYELLGSSERYCLPHGQWTGQLARCDLPTNYCPNPGIPIKGSKESTNYDLGSKMVFNCQDGYTQLGSNIRECLVNHIWSGTEAKCLGRYDFNDAASIIEKLSKEILRKEEQQKMAFEKYKERVFSKLSSGARKKTPTTIHYPGRIILHFVLDVSTSIGHVSFNRGIELCKAIVKKVGISKNGTRAGALTFGSKTDVKLIPFECETTEDVLDALNKIKYTDEGVPSSSPLTSLRRGIFPLNAYEFGKKNVKSIILLVSDGRTNISEGLEEEAKILKTAGVEIYCIGITGDIRKETLYRIASKSKNELGEAYSNVYILKSDATFSSHEQEKTNEKIDYSQCGDRLEKVGKDGSRGRKSNGPWPWMAALYFETGKDVHSRYQLACGGSLIHPRFILTAAHCMFKHRQVMRDKKSILIKLGLTNTRNETYVQESEVQEMFVHSRYKPGDIFDYDIALLQIVRPAEYNAFVRPICLPPKQLTDRSLLYQPGSSAWAVGWGHDSRIATFPIKSSQILKEIYLPIQSKDRCIESVRNNGMNVSYFTDLMFCAGNGTGGSDVCAGDGGAPLMQPQTNSEGYMYWTQIGIVSWGIGCGLEDTYGYYTYLQKLMPWVDDTMENVLKAMDV